MITRNQAPADPILEERLTRLQWASLLVGLAALAVSGVGAFLNTRQFFFSYLYGYLFWLGLSLGCFAVHMLHQLTGGRWGYPTRRFLEAGFMVLPLMLVLLVPVLLGLHDLYPWARPDEVLRDKALQLRHGYENAWAFTLRQLFFLLLWIWMAALLRRWSLAQDRTEDAIPTRKARALSGPGLVIYGLVVTFASVDWIMSLETNWYSTIFAVIVMGGQVLSAFAFCVLALTFCRRSEPFAPIVTRVQYHQLGNLLLTFVLFWTYVAFGQLLIIYSGDLPHELEWYLHRIAGSWKIVVAVIALFHFFLPFFLLLFRPLKMNAAALTVLAAMLFVIHIVDTYWLVMPSLHPQQVAVSWLDFTAPLGIGGLWLAWFVWRLKAAPLLPQNDPGMQFAFVYVKP